MNRQQNLSEQNIIDEIALSMLPKVGSKTAGHLISVFGTATRLFGSSHEELTSVGNLSTDLAISIIKKVSHNSAIKEFKLCRKNGIEIIPAPCDDYPSILKECGDRPHILYALGNSGILNNKSLSLIGTRRITSYGQRVCEKVIPDIAAAAPDAVLVNGLSYGVEATALRTALSVKMPCIVVLANPLPQIYPSGLETLARKVTEQGGVIISEYSSTAQPGNKAIIARNRIIAGISRGIVVVESPLKGGALMTADMAFGYDRSVMAVPGRIDDICSEGTNDLIRQNKAALVNSATEILSELGWASENINRNWRVEIALDNPSQNLVLNSIDYGEKVGIEDILIRTGMPISEILIIMIELDFAGLVRELPGKLYERI